MHQSEDGTIDLSYFRNKRLMEVLMFAERLMPGVWRVVKNLNDHEGTLDVEVSDSDSMSIIHEVFRQAWSFVCENPDCVEISFKSDIERETN